MTGIERGPDGLPVTTEKELAAIETLLCDPKYRIKEPGGFLRANRRNLLNPDFVLYTLNDFLGHIQSFVVATKKMIPPGRSEAFFTPIRNWNPTAEGILRAVSAIDLKTLSQMLTHIQSVARSVSLSAVQPFIKALYKNLIRIYYISAAYGAHCYRGICKHILDSGIASDPEGLRNDTLTAIREFSYLHEKIFPALYPLVLRMVSPVMLDEHDLFYKNGSKVLAWLETDAKEILFPAPEKPLPAAVPKAAEEEKNDGPPPQAAIGLSTLEKLFPEAGWETLPRFPEEVRDFAPYFAPVLQFSDAFIQLNPANPMHITMILFQILAELFQGLRHVNFNVPTKDNPQEEDDIYLILDDWILYKANLFDKTFGDDIKSYTHQIYSQPEFAKSPYAVKLMSHMYSMIRQYFMPYFDTRLYGFQKMTKDPKLPPLYSRVRGLKTLLEAYSAAIEKARTNHLSSGGEAARLPGGVVNAFEPYRFDISNAVSKRLDALCGGRNSRQRTNAMLLRYCLSILCVLDWWINDEKSPAYKSRPELLYRTVEPGSPMPAFGITARTDTDEIFRMHLHRLTR